MKESIHSFIGVFVTAAATFLSSYLLLHLSNSEDFSKFSIFIIIQALMFGIINAVILTPFSKCYYSSQDEKEDIFATFYNHGLALSILFGFSFAFFNFSLGYSLKLTLASGFVVFFGSYRWMLRGLFQNKMNYKGVFKSDLALGFTVIFLLIILFLGLYEASLYSIFLINLFASLISIFPISGGIRNFRLVKNNKFVESFRTQGRFSLIGVTANELSINSFPFFIIHYYGHYYYAPLAAAFLYFRPLSIFLNNIFQMKRGYLVKMYAQENFSVINSQYIKILLAIVLFFLLNTLLIFLIFIFNAEILWPSVESKSIFLTALFCSVFVFFIRVLRMFLGFALQISNKFKTLSNCTILHFLSSLIVMFLFCTYFSFYFIPFALVIVEFIGFAIIIRSILKYKVLQCHSSQLP